MGVFSLWGRFSLRNRLSKFELTDDYFQFLELINNHRTTVLRVDCPAPRLVSVTYEPREFFICENPATNVVISLFTTSAGRLRLLEAMEKVDQCPGAQCLYTDTVYFSNLQLN